MKKTELLIEVANVTQTIKAKLAGLSHLAPDAELAARSIEWLRMHAGVCRRQLQSMRAA